MTKEAWHRHIKGDGTYKNGYKLIGICLALIGFFWFANNVGWLPVASSGFAIVWPAAVIALGMFIIVGVRHKNNNHSK